MKQISTEELQQKLLAGEKLNIIDVREVNEVTMGKIPAAKNIPLGEIPFRLNELQSSQHYYVICHSGARSSSACEYLTQNGYDVTNVTGGMLAWNGEIK